jgi:hypothetical protein
MKKNLTWIIVAFLAGILIGCAILWFCCCGCGNKSCEKSCDKRQCNVCDLDSLTPAPILIDTITAKNYFQTYLLAPEGHDTINGFTINLEQFRAMCMILNADTTASVHGFRIYLGADSIPGNRVYMVVGIGSPDKVGTIYKTSAVNSGLCPIVCDSSSPITD